MLSNQIRAALLIVLAFAFTRPVAAQDYDNPIIPDWPQYGYGFTQGFFRTGNGKVDLQGLILRYVAQLKYVPDYYGLRVGYEQALAIAEHEKAKQAVLARGWIELNQAEQAGDEQAIREARRHYHAISAMVGETSDDMFHEMIVNTFDETQLDTIKSMCINVAMNHVSLRDLFRQRTELFSESGLTEKEIAELRKAVAEAEMELQREVMELRRKAWDKVMSKLPAELVEKLEDQLGFGGLVKAK